LKSTIKDIAEKAGVSQATVDRVLNERPGVKATNRHRVLQAARVLGYLPETRNMAMPARPARLEFILPVGTNLFMADLAEHIENYCARLPLVLSCNVRRLETASAESFVSALEDLHEATAGVGILAVDDPRTRSAVNRLCEAGVRVVTITSDLPSTSRADYVGIDNRLAGRTVGLLMGQMLNSDRKGVAVFLGSRQYRGHEEREAGFRSVFSEMFPDVEIGATIEVADESQRSYRAAQALFARNPDIGGVYCAGGGRAGIVRAVQEQFGDQRPLVFCHDLTEQTREALLNGTLDIVVDQNARLMAEQATIHLLGALATNAPYLTKKLVEPRLITRENIPVAR